MLILRGVISFRSVPRILEMFYLGQQKKANWIPHFTSVINWTMRLGLGLLLQVKTTNKPWAAIIDHSIDIGTKKALVVLRIDLEILSNKGEAIQLKDCECIGLKISEVVNGDSIATELQQIFSQSGHPDVIIKDCDRTLNKGVLLYSEQQGIEIPIIEDIGHVVASALKSEYAKTEGYKQFTKLTNEGAKKLRQTALAFLIPPKLRSKGRFQNVSKLGKWGIRMLNVFATTETAENADSMEKLQEAFPELNDMRPFIEQFANTSNILSSMMKILKNKGLNQINHDLCRQLIAEIPEHNKVHSRITNWLKLHLKLHEKLATQSLLVSSDIIESLFGNFKHIIERSPQADMNRTTLLIPALCGNLDHTKIVQALEQANCYELKHWEQMNIPYTMRRKRQNFFHNNIQN